MNISRSEFLSRVDCTLLDANATPDDFRKMARYAHKQECRAICVPMGSLNVCRIQFTHTAKRPLQCVVIDFPDGSLDSVLRAYLVKEAKMRGVDECDVVMRIGDFVAGDYAKVAEDLAGINFARYSLYSGKELLRVKVIVETGYLSDKQILKSAEMVQASGAFCWKTSTGRDPKVAIPEKARHVRLVREAFPDLKIKAAGGIRTREDMEMLAEAGADIFGISWKSLEEIVKNWQ
jgi:deoxyribose-phosphate aldolase